jgi:hypothetical protein
MSACELLPRFPGVKDPDDRVNIKFKGRPPAGVTVTSVTVTEVDEADVAVPVSAFTFGTIAVLPSTDGSFWSATCSVDGGVANPVATAGVRPAPTLYLLAKPLVSFQTVRTAIALSCLYVGHN